MSTLYVLASRTHAKIGLSSRADVLLRVRDVQADHRRRAGALRLVATVDASVLIERHIHWMLNSAAVKSDRATPGSRSELFRLTGSVRRCIAFISAHTPFRRLRATPIRVHVLGGDHEPTAPEFVVDAVPPDVTMKDVYQAARVPSHVLAAFMDSKQVSAEYARRIVQAAASLHRTERPLAARRCIEQVSCADQARWRPKTTE
jgi:hypothetical protein